MIAAGADQSLVFIDAASGKTVRRSRKMPNAVFDLKLSPNGSEIAVVTLEANDLGAPSPVVALDVTSLDEKARTTTEKMVGGGWTADGHLICAIATDGAVRLSRLR